MAAAKAECESAQAAEFAHLHAQSNAEILAYHNQLKLDAAAVKDDLHLQAVQSLQLASKSTAKSTHKYRCVDPLACSPSHASAPGESLPTSPDHTPVPSPLTPLHSLPLESAAASSSSPLITFPTQVVPSSQTPGLLSPAVPANIRGGLEAKVHLLEIHLGAVIACLTNLKECSEHLLYEDDLMAPPTGPLGAAHPSAACRVM
jgi:hypothetical protein